MDPLGEQTRILLGSLALAAATACAAGPSPLAGLHPPGEPPALQPAGPGEARRILADPAAPWPRKRVCWDHARSRGWTARLEEEARAATRREGDRLRPWVDLGNLLVLKLGDEEGLFARARLAREAEECFDRALALDPDHWEASFQKAVTLGHWPAYTGRRREAAAILEGLLQRQEGRPREERFALTWLFLGNLQAQAGEKERARETWRRGLARHPGNRQLRRKLAGGEEGDHAR